MCPAPGTSITSGLAGSRSASRCEWRGGVIRSRWPAITTAGTARGCPRPSKTSIFESVPPLAPRTRGAQSRTMWATSATSSSRGSGPKATWRTPMRRNGLGDVGEGQLVGEQRARRTPPAPGRAPAGCAARASRRAGRPSRCRASPRPRRGARPRRGGAGPRRRSSSPPSSGRTGPPARPRQGSPRGQPRDRRRRPRSRSRGARGSALDPWPAEVVGDQPRLAAELADLAVPELQRAHPGVDQDDGRRVRGSRTPRRGCGFRRRSRPSAPARAASSTRAASLPDP